MDFVAESCLGCGECPVLISVVCPRCGETYNVQDSLRGKPMRCLRPSCGKLFLIDDPPAAQKQQSGSVGDLIPLLPLDDEPKSTHVTDTLELLPVQVDHSEVIPLEVVDPNEEEPIEAVPVEENPVAGWTSPPPVRRKSTAPVKQPDESPRPTPPPRRERPPVVDDPHVLEPGNGDAPPVRGKPKGQAESEPDSVSHEAITETLPVERHSDYELHLKPRTRWLKWAIVPLLFLTVAGLAVGLTLIWAATRETQEKLAQEAADYFDNGQFAQAEKLYHRLAEDYSDSDEVGFYRYREELAQLRQRLADSDDELAQVLDHAGQFVKERQKDPFLEKDVARFAEALLDRVAGFAKQASNDLVNGEEAFALQDKAKPIIESLRKVRRPRTDPAPQWSKVDEAFADLRRSLDQLRAKLLAMKRLEDLAQSKSGYAAIQAVENYLREIRPTYPDVGDSEETRKLLQELYDKHLKSVRYSTASAGEDGPSRAGGGQLDEPSLAFDPVVVPAEGKPSSLSNPDEIPALALVRGVLYALDRATGKVRWTRRVGIDTTTLPVLVPQRVAQKDLLLVLSSDTNTLTALNVRGGVEWSYLLPAPVLGRPVVAERRAYLATYTGEVHEIELSQGRLLGTYNLGQRLTLGGVAEPNSSRVYFPADDHCVYILDVAKRRCERILYSGHPAGSLRGEPIILPALDEETPGRLILNQATGLDGVRLRVFDLPIIDGRAAERVFSPPATLAGWTWFNPYHDPEKIILISDAGRLGLFGTRQPFNRDEPLFSLLPEGSYDLAARFRGARRGRAEVAHVEGDDLWVLAAERLQRLRLAWGFAQGPRLVDVWKEPLPIGSPLHATQSINGQLITVTRPSRRSCTWVSSIDRKTGKLNWRRQLGLLAATTPVPLRTNEGESPLWLALDQAGGLFVLDPTLYSVNRETRWLFDSRRQLAEGVEENVEEDPLVLLHPEGTSAYVLAFPGEGQEMLVREVLGTGSTLRVENKKLQLGEKLSGTPLLLGQRMLLPTSDGLIKRLALPMSAEPTTEDGPLWRAERIGADARCVLVPLGESRFVSSDGGSGLMVWDWPVGKDSTPLPANRAEDEPTLRWKDRIVHAVALPGQTEFVLGDSRGGLALVQVEGNGSLTVQRSWSLGGEITAGPFLRQTPEGPRIGCVVGQTKLVWLDPASNQPGKEYHTQDDAPIVGEPQVCGEWLVVADQSGRLVGLSLTDLSPRGRGYNLPGSLAPVTSPVLFQPDRLLVPLSDGTVLLLSTARFR